MALLKSIYGPYDHLEDEEDYTPFNKNNGSREIPKQQRHSCSVCKMLPAFGVVLTVLLVAAVMVGLFPIQLLAFGTRENGVHNHGQVKSESFDDAVLVETTCNTLAGTIEDGAFVFKGIPFARPPVGSLRWRKPVPIWSDPSKCKKHSLRSAKNFSQPCFQLNPYNKKYEGQEDCLYLNVWSPRLDATAGLEVMVWIHGGFLQFGSGHQEGMRPNGRIARDLNLVFVSFNYRLHAMGFLALDTITEDSNGNYGLWDQIAALQWIKMNIKNFGGDPNKVTVLGCDAGAASILAMMTTKVAEGLFRSAWIVGPTLFFNRTFDEASWHNKLFFYHRSGCSDAACLRGMSPRQVTEAYLGKDDPSFRIRDQNDLPIQGIFSDQMIVVDGDFVRYPIFDAFQNGEIIDIPLLIGTSAQAIEFWPGPDDLRYWTWTQYKKYVSTSLDSFGSWISEMALQLYENSTADPEVTPEILYTSMVSDLRQNCPIQDMAEAAAQSLQSPIYRYIVTSRPSKPVQLYDYKAMFSFHPWDIVSFFDIAEDYIHDLSEEEIGFRDELHQVVVNFVKSGGQSVSYDDWETVPHSIALFSSNLTFYEEYHKSMCQFWSSHGFTAYAWSS